jgi:phosphoribosylformimino-5-aminoimidazole carboxamide ribotide isomerase
MTILPAIDLKDGRCVRLHQGDMTTAVVYGEDPVAMARHWEAQGARYLHVVDLDGAVAGCPVNAALIGAICAAVAVPVEVGGGIRTGDAARALIDGGAARIILGTAAYGDPDFLSGLCGAFPGRIAVGIDARDGEVAGRGWTEQSGVRATTLAAQVAATGVACVIYTDIARDGTETGPNLETTRAMAQVLAPAGVPLIASGGVGAIEDVERVLALEPDGVTGLIVGRALYTGAVSLPAALAVAARRSSRGRGDA